MKYSQMHVKRRGLAACLSLAWCGVFTGCAGSHIVDVLGSYFPFWLLCMLLGVVAAFVARTLFLKLKIESYVGPTPLIYLCVVIAISCLAWMIAT